MLQKINFILVLFCFERIYGLKQCEDCVFISSCENAKSLEDEIDDLDVRKKFSDSLCGYQSLNSISSKPKICCSDFTDITVRFNVDDEKIANHDNLVLLPDDCGPLDASSGQRIVGGGKAKLYEFPWMALLSFNRIGTERKNFNCGGTIINSRYILTAAHCFDNRREKLIGVRVGEYDIGSKIDCQGAINLECESHIQNLFVEKIIRHENYEKDIMVNDIALIRTRTPIDFGHRNVKPVCLPVFEELRNKNLGGINVTVAGWGRITDKSLRRSNILQSVVIPVWEKADCMNTPSVGNSESLKILCAGEKGKDSCNGDSGGPLMTVDEYLDVNRMVQFGIVSKGPKSCGSEGPGIYTDLTKYIYWILENIEK